MNWDVLVLQFVVLIISLTFHEASHAWLAKLGGDLTPYRSGQVTLNPLPHMQREPFGMVLLPLITLFSSEGRMCLGFAHAPFDPYWASRHPKRAALMSLAGPLANIFLAAVAFVVLWFIARPDSDAERTVGKIAIAFLRLNLFLALLNLIPLPPLDGAGVVRGLFPRAGRVLDTIENIPYSTLIVLVLVSLYLGEPFWRLFFEVDSWLPYSTTFYR